MRRMSFLQRVLSSWLLPLALTALVAVSALGVMVNTPSGWLGLSAAPPADALAAAQTSRIASAAIPSAATGRGLPLPPPGQMLSGHELLTPAALRAAYNLNPLYDFGFDGQGQTVVVIVSFGSPTLQADVATFCQFYGLPPATVTVLAPLGVHPFDANNTSMAAWARETEEDVETIHAFAPGAKIVVLTSPVDETQGTTGLPEFRALEQYALTWHLGTIISQSWGASEATLNTAAGRLEVEQWDQFYQRATQAGITFLAASGDHGATDWGDAAMRALAPYPTTTFPASDPWVTAVGGTALTRGTAGFTETSWSGSGGGYSALFVAPDYQHRPAYAGRGVPDVAAQADWLSGLGVYERGEWRVARGTSASAPLWAALVALADQMAGRPLGDINPALYALAGAPATASDFYDITTGGNSYAGDGIRVAGYHAVAGWDAVTGLGTPNAARLIPDLVTAALAPSPQ